MTSLSRTRKRLWPLTLTFLLACSDDGAATTTDTEDSSSSSTDGDGDGDPSSGDGDGDPSGDGDGDPSTGDGDGDPSTGDGDGDPSTGDGDGDPSTGDGDGDPSTGDGDGDAEPNCPDLVVSYSADVQPMFDVGCTGNCHAAPNPSAGLDLSAGNSHAELVGVDSLQCDARLLVAPGDPGASYLVDKLRNTNLCGGSRMPKGAPAWSDQQIELVEAWVCNGALDD